ncbi:hypothetical protein J2T57_003817 [Natronocella acetinitrilica]|uniref:Helix-turn-helix domain-containing protein n=1 Tax=Natronocella acetinitrilica TaxID=414046 RepID=A0AAE3G8B2_9GAMM|nr:hypothetical protein [Natronocella acetinitrilica]
MTHTKQNLKKHQTNQPQVEDYEGCINIGGCDIGFDELVSPQVAAKIAGLSPRSLRRLVSQGELAVYRYAPNSMRYLVRDLLEWTEERRIEPEERIHVLPTST